MTEFSLHIYLDCLIESEKKSSQKGQHSRSEFYDISILRFKETSFKGINEILP